MPNDKLPMVAQAVFTQCKAQRADDAAGLASDPFLNNPLSCTPDLEALGCADSDGADCLTRPEADALQAMYDGPRDAETGERIYFGWPVGSENAGTNPERPGWSNYWSDSPAQSVLPASASGRYGPLMTRTGHGGMWIWSRTWPVRMTGLPNG